MEMDIKAIEQAYEKANSGTAQPDYAVVTPESMKAIAGRLPEPKRSEWIAFADACPFNSVIEITKTSARYVTQTI